LGPTEAGSEYLRVVEDFPESLPFDETFPETVPAQLQKDVAYGKGAGEAYAYFYWRCAWSNQYLLAFDVNDEQTMASALEVLAKWTETGVYRDHVVEEPGAGWQEMVVNPARLGDPTILRAMDVTDCDLYRTAQGEQ